MLDTEEEKPSREELELELYELDREINRRRYLTDPENWVVERLGDFVWSKQREILRSVRDNRLTAVHSCHESGKSFIAARVAAWWIETHLPGEALVVTSAPTDSQVRLILWAEINSAHAKAGLSGRTTNKEWLIVLPAGNEKTVAIGRKPADYDPSAFQGLHAKYVLVIFDEACGMPKALWDSGYSLVANDYSRFLAIGNPDNPATEFCNVCKPGSGWNVIGIDAFDTPNFTDEYVPEELRPVLIGKTWVEERKRQWGEDNPIYIAKVRGKFPVVSEDCLIPIPWVEQAKLRDLEPGEPNELGVDVGGGGSGKNCVAHRRGGYVRIIRKDNEPNTMVSCGKLVLNIQETGATRVKIDRIGIGDGITNRAIELGHPVVGIAVGMTASENQKFTNIRAEGYWGLRERFQAGEIDIDPNDLDLLAQLVDIRYKPTSAGKIQIESKEEMKRRGRSSPDELDSVMLAFLPDHLCGPIPGEMVPVFWG